MKNIPDLKGYFGNYGGNFLPEEFKNITEEISDKYQEIVKQKDFQEELTDLLKNYVGRPSPIYYAKNLTEKFNGAKIFFKREDLNHTGAHKINHCLGEALLAKKMGKKKLIAETGAGQHGVALATAAALLGLDCDIHMGEVDIQKESLNVYKMKILGAKVISVSKGQKTLKEAVDSAFEAYLKDTKTQFYAIGSIVGPHPFPMMVRDFQQIIGIEAKEQFNELTGNNPDNLIACVGGGSNSIGLFSAFLDCENINIYGVEPAGKSFKNGEHAATITQGKPGIIHGFKSYLLQDKMGEPLKVYSVASGLDYPGVGPEHSFLHDINRVKYVTINDLEAIEAFFMLSKVEGIIPALESSHAVAFAVKLAKTLSKDKTILVNLSGRGDKDLKFISENYKD